MAGLSRRDRKAMKAAIEAARADDEGTREQIDHFLRERPWEEVGAFAAFHCQMERLDLRPWQHPPVWIEPADIPRLLAGPDRDRHAGKREAAELLQRMLRLGISRFSPDPLAEIEAAEAGKKLPVPGSFPMSK